MRVRYSRAVPESLPADAGPGGFELEQVLIENTCGDVARPGDGSVRGPGLVASALGRPLSSANLANQVSALQHTLRVGKALRPGAARPYRGYGAATSYLGISGSSSTLPSRSSRKTRLSSVAKPLSVEVMSLATIRWRPLPASFS